MEDGRRTGLIFEGRVSLEDRGPVDTNPTRSLLRLFELRRVHERGDLVNDNDFDSEKLTVPNPVRDVDPSSRTMVVPCDPVPPISFSRLAGGVNTHVDNGIDLNIRFPASTG